MTEQEIQFMMKDLEEQAKLVPDDFVEWHWYGLKEKLADGDILKFPEVGKTNIIECLNLLSYWHKRDKDYAKQLKKQTEQNNKQQLMNF